MFFVPWEFHMNFTSLIIHFPTIEIHVPCILVRISLHYLLKSPQRCRKWKEHLYSCLMLKWPGSNDWKLEHLGVHSSAIDHQHNRNLYFVQNPPSSCLTSAPKIPQEPFANKALVRTQSLKALEVMSHTTSFKFTTCSTTGESTVCVQCQGIWNVWGKEPVLRSNTHCKWPIMHRRCLKARQTRTDWFRVQMLSHLGIKRLQFPLKKESPFWKEPYTDFRFLSPSVSVVFKYKWSVCVSFLFIPFHI